MVEVEWGSCAPAAAAAAAERRSDAGSMNTSDELPVSRTPLVPPAAPRPVSRDLLQIDVLVIEAALLRTSYKMN